MMWIPVLPGGAQIQNTSHLRCLIARSPQLPRKWSAVIYVTRAAFCPQTIPRVTLFFHLLGLGSRRIAYNNMMAAGGNRQYAPPPFRILKIIRNEIWVDSVQK